MQILYRNILDVVVNSRNESAGADHGLGMYSNTRRDLDEIGFFKQVGISIRFF
jgi:hypothetical protein